MHVGNQIMGGEIETVNCKTALIIDDSAFTRMLLSSALKSCGVTTVYHAQDGEEALQNIARPEMPLDVMFCDLDMPNVDGIQFIRMAATFERRPTLVLVSGAPERTRRAAQTLARDTGLNVAGVLAKPFRQSDIASILAGIKPASVDLPPRPKSAEADARELADGIARGELELHFQPKVKMATRELTGVEALVRWRHPVHGLQFPDSFIPVAERENLIGPLTYAVVERAVAQCASWRAEGLHCKVGVNLSPKMITDEALPDWLAGTIKAAGLTPSDLVFEVTESGMFTDNLLSMEILARLDLHGHDLSIDDFGTGYSSMEQLKRLPFAELKIDKMFVTGIAENSVNQTIIYSSVELARKLRMSVVVEGVETREDWSFVYGAGCDVAQGYFISRPMPAEKLAPWLRDWEGRTDIPLAATGTG